MESPVKLEIRGQSFELRSERTVYWAEKKTLLAADLHWGKDIIFHQHGLPVPSGTLAADLKRLTSEIKETGASRLLILGDLVHHKKALTPELVAQITEWREGFKNLQISLILGNHDRGLVTPETWAMTVQPSFLEEGPFLFSHDDVESDEHFVWTGHVHPVIRLKSATDSLRLPCFVLEVNKGLLPAFSLFTGGAEIRARKERSIFAIADTQVVPI